MGLVHLVSPVVLLNFSFYFFFYVASQSNSPLNLQWLLSPAIFLKRFSSKNLPFSKLNHWMRERLNYWNYCLANAEWSTLPHWDPGKGFWEIKIILLIWNKTALPGIRSALCQRDLPRERERRMNLVKREKKNGRKTSPASLPIWKSPS